MSQPRKSVFITLALVLMLAAVLSACSKSDTASPDTSASSGNSGSKENIKLRMTVWGSPEEVAPYKKAIQNFEAKHPSVKVELQHIAADYDTKLTTMVAGNDVPDIAMMESGTIAFPMAEQGKFYNLQEFLDTDADISPDTLVPNITYSLEPGNVIGIGPGPESFGLFYNEDIFKEAGVEPPPSNVADAWTWDEFVEVAKKLTVDMNGKTAADPDFDPAKSSNMEQISPPGGGVQQLHLFQRRGFHLGGRQNLRP